jgi:hypothetical protein
MSTTSNASTCPSCGFPAQPLTRCGWCGGWVPGAARPRRRRLLSSLAGLFRRRRPAPREVNYAEMHA